MFKKLFLTFFLLCISFLTIYPSKKENTNLFDYCFSFEKILSRNYIEKNKNLSERIKTFSKDIYLFGTNKTKGALAQKIINQYKISKQSFIMNLVPDKYYCLVGYWAEELNPGIFSSIFYEKGKQRINQYKDIKKEVDEFIKDIDLKYDLIEKEFNKLF